MSFTRVRISHILPFALIVCAAMTPVGCGPEEGVKKYDVPKSTESKKSNAATGEYRMLGAMIPADNPVWFFKFSGPAEDITKYEEGFDELLKSVKLNGNAPLDFTPPKDWKKGAGRSGFVVATVKTPDDKYEVTITQAAGSVEENLKRWVGQIGQKPGPNDVQDYTKTIETASKVKGVRVDLKGPNDPSTKRGGPMMPPGR